MVDKNYMKMKIRDMENAFRYRRIPYPKRSVELIALIAISCTFFLFMHTKNLNTRLREMEVKLQPSEFSALGLTGEHHISGGDGSRHSDDINTLHGTYQYLKSTGQETLDTLNNTKTAEIDILMFNRVPKTGSQSLMELILRLGRINNFITTKDPPKIHETVSLDAPMLNTLANDIINFIPPPYAYSQHVAYINFTDLSLPRPIYINLVRDPIERVISWHYYIRRNEYYEDLKKKHGEQAIKVPDQTFLDMDFETCVKTNSPYCRFVQNQVNGVGDHRRQMLFFCGQDKKKCLPFNSNGSLQRAKRVVEQDYAVVGIWEDTNITLSVLEHYIPKFFKYAKAAYYLEYDKLSNVNKNKMKRTVTHEVRELVRKNFTREIEFYEFCRQRLYRQYAAITTKLGDEDDYMLLPDSL